MSVRFKLDFFINPLVLSTVFLTALNDHYLKYKYPGIITGKISDFTGLFYFSLFVVAVVLYVQTIVNRKTCVLSQRLLLGSIISIDIVFLILKLHPQISQIFVFYFSKYFFSIKIVNDPTDLFALISSVICYQYAKTFLPNSIKVE